MCGIAGLITSQSNDLAPAELVARMIAPLAHRGPDDSGVWTSENGQVGLGHRRLSIIDLSAEGHQPMASACGRYVLVYNGEIYNYKTLRKELERTGSDINWRGHSDTEVLVESVAHWGLDKTIGKLNGMFAFAVWDRKKQTLSLVRDRLGIKPLYYGWAERNFVFGSELKALRNLPTWDNDINRYSPGLFLRHSYVPAPHTIHENTRKLLPGQVLTLSLQDVNSHRLPTPSFCWDPRNIIEECMREPLDIDATDAKKKLNHLLLDSVGLRMEADVPLGAFLSGGYDSSTVVALMQAQSSQPARTFSIGFREPDYDEAEYAGEVARHLGTDHNELYVTPEQARNVIPQLPEIYDEPFADSSQIPTFLVSKLARREVTVSLSGDGGDELFYGYNRYRTTARLWSKLRLIPFRRLFGSIAGVLPSFVWALVSRLRNAGGSHSRPNRAPRYLAKRVKELLGLKDPLPLSQDLLSHWKKPGDIVKGVEEESLAPDREDNPLTELEFAMMYHDLVGYLPGDILTKVDRASMAVSLEARVPLLDHRVVEFAWRLPKRIRIEKGPKWLLRQVLYDYVPPELVDRPKKGFGVPIGSWLRGPLREWGEDLLSPDRLEREGYLQPKPIRKKWEQHIAGDCDWAYYLWDVLMFEQWVRDK
ncbi:MAG: asparagine synthase (glutamine-hydrolyzing) [Candidatus Brocadiia bacterium]